MLRPSLPRRLRAAATTAALVLAAAVGVSAPAGAVADGYPIADVPATGSVQTNIPVTVVCPYVEDQPWTIASWVTSEGSGILKTAHGTLADAQMVYSGSVWFSSPAPSGYVDVRCGYEDGDGRETWVSSGRFPISVAAPVVATTTTVAVAPSVTLPGTLPVVATVSTSGGAVTTGSVQFSVDGVDVGAPVAVDAHGEARTDLGAPAPGHRSVSARYLGASGLATSASAGSPVQVLAEAGVTLTLPSTATDAAPVPLRADVLGTDGLAAPGGTVTFTWDDGSLGSAPVVAGVAQLDVTLPAGTYPGVTATYSGDLVHGSATSSGQTLVVVEHVAPRPVVTVDVPTTAVAGPVTVTVTVAGPHSEAVTPEGDVQLIVLDADEHYLLHVNATLVDGTVDVTTPALAAGSYTVLAHYSGSSTQGVYAQADSTYHALTVTAPVVTPDPQPSDPQPSTPQPSAPAPTTPPAPAVPTPAVVPALTGSTSSTTPGESVTLVARGFQPGETVQFHLHSDPVLLGTAVADASGVATLVTTVPAGTAAGLHHVVATGTTSQRTAQIELTVAAAGTSSGTRLASTGSDPAGLLGLVAALLVAGAAMVATPRVGARR